MAFYFEVTVVSAFGFSDPVSSLSHFLGAIFFLISSCSLIYHGRGNALRVIALSIYCFSIVFLLSMSGTYHLLGHGTVARAVLQRLDHSGIWFLIIGSFVPLHIILFKRFWRWFILLLVWAVGVTGLVLEAVFFREMSETLTLSLYMLLGWFGLISAYAYVRHAYPLKPALLLVGGGLCYSLGAVLDYNRWPVLWQQVFQAHELFHVFVLAGIYCHFCFVWTIADMAISPRLTLVVKRRKDGPSFAKAISENIRFLFTTQKEFEEKLRASVEQIYRHKRPEVLRIKYVDEDFVALKSDEISLVSSDAYHS